MPHGWKLCLQAFHLSFLTCGCYGFLSLLGLALEEGQAVHSTKSQRHQLHHHRPFGYVLNYIKPSSHPEPQTFPPQQNEFGLGPRRCPLVLAPGGAVFASARIHVAFHGTDFSIAQICFAEFYPALSSPLPSHSQDITPGVVSAPCQSTMAQHSSPDFR